MQIHTRVRTDTRAQEKRVLNLVLKDLGDGESRPDRRERSRVVDLQGTGVREFIELHFSLPTLSFTNGV